MSTAAPVQFDDVKRAWIVTGYDEAVAVLLDQEHFSAVNSIGIEPFETLAPEVGEILARGRPRFPGIIEMDPPEHTRYRQLVSAAFTPRRVAALEPTMRAIADELIDELAPAGRADFVQAFGDPLPIRVIGVILGVPPEDTDHVQHLSESFRTLEAGTISQLPIERQIETAERFVAFQDYVGRMVDERRRDPGDDLVSVIAHTKLGDERLLTTDELVSTVIHLLFAGQETTTRLLASLVCTLLSDRARWEEMVADPGLVPGAVEEALRTSPPVTYHMRRVKQDVELGGAALRAGDDVHVVFAAANRDPAMFPEPDRFDPRRANANRHLGLGRGVHFCVGAPVGRLEARVGIETLLARMPGLRMPDGAEPVYEDHVMLSGIASLPVEWDPAGVRPAPAGAPA